MVLEMFLLANTKYALATQYLPARQTRRVAASTLRTRQPVQGRPRPLRLVQTMCGKLVCTGRMTVSYSICAGLVRYLGA